MKDSVKNVVVSMRLRFTKLCLEKARIGTFQGGRGSVLRRTI
jgi:hypothetical protein